MISQTRRGFPGLRVLRVGLVLHVSQVTSRFPVPASCSQI